MGKILDDFYEVFAEGKEFEELDSRLTREYESHIQEIKEHLPLGADTGRNVFGSVSGQERGLRAGIPGSNAFDDGVVWVKICKELSRIDRNAGFYL